MLKEWIDQRKKELSPLPAMQQAGALMILEEIEKMGPATSEADHTNDLTTDKATDKGQWMNAKAAAQKLGVNELTIRRWGKDGALKTSQPSGKVYGRIYFLINL